MGCLSRVRLCAVSTLKEWALCELAVDLAYLFLVRV